MSNVTAIVQVPQHSMQSRSDRVEWSQAQRKIIKDTFLNGASDEEAQVLMETAAHRGLDPLKNQIYFVKRFDSAKGGHVWSFQVSIDALRAQADATGEMDGQDEAEFQEAEDGSLILAKVRVYKKGCSRPFVGVAYFSEYVQTTRSGDPNRMWKQLPHAMLAKCAEALALRKAFPAPLGGLYTSEEMGQAENETRFQRLPQQQQAKALPAKSEEPEPKAEWEDALAELPGLLAAAAMPADVARVSASHSKRFKGCPNDVRAQVKQLFDEARLAASAREEAATAEAAQEVQAEET